MMESFVERDETEWRKFNLHGGMSRSFVEQVHRKRRAEAAKAVAVAMASEEASHAARIESILRQLMQKRGMPEWVRDMVRMAAGAACVSPVQLIGDCRTRHVVAARNALLYAIKDAKPRLSSTQIGNWFGKDHTSILHGIASHQKATGVPAIVGYDIDACRAANKRRANARDSARRAAREAR